MALLSSNKVMLDGKVYTYVVYHMRVAVIIHTKYICSISHV